MALKVVSMEELKLEVLLEPERTGETVVEVCARHGLSRASYYRYRRRYVEEGAAGLTPSVAPAAIIAGADRARARGADRRAPPPTRALGGAPDPR
jgi:transposase-like protein